MKALHVIEGEVAAHVTFWKDQIWWNGTRLEHWATPKYLGVTLDRTLTFKNHCSNTKQFFLLPGQEQP